jgi:hypothetical protein
MNAALTASMTNLPEQLRKTLTWDRGKELSGHTPFALETGTQVFFADPDSPWQPKLKFEPAWDPKEHPGSRRAVWAYSAKREARDAKTLTLQENRAKAVIAGEKGARTPRFVTVKNGRTTLDEAS